MPDPNIIIHNTSKAKNLDDLAIQDVMVGLHDEHEAKEVSAGIYERDKVISIKETYHKDAWGCCTETVVLQEVNLV